MFTLCSYLSMDRIDRTRIADILLAAPAWARVGLTVRDARMRERAADTLAATILEKLADRGPVDQAEPIIAI